MQGDLQNKFFLQNSRPLLYNCGMKKYALKDYVKEHTLEQAGQIMGVKRGAVWQAVRANREIFFGVHRGGRGEDYEIKSPGNSRKKNQYLV